MTEEEKSIREIYDGLLKESSDPKNLASFQSLITFIDDALSKAYGKNGDDRASFIMKSMLNIRDFLKSEILTAQSRLLLLNSVDKKIGKMFKKEEEVVEVPAEKKQDTRPPEDI